MVHYQDTDHQIDTIKKDYMKVKLLKKLRKRYTWYKFTDEETEQLKEVLMDMSADIQDLCGMTFNEALKKIANK